MTKFLCPRSCYSTVRVGSSKFRIHFPIKLLITFTSALRVLRQSSPFLTQGCARLWSQNTVAVYLTNTELARCHMEFVMTGVFVTTSFDKRCMCTYYQQQLQSRAGIREVSGLNAKIRLMEPWTDSAVGMWEIWGSWSGVAEDSTLLVCYTVSSNLTIQFTNRDGVTTQKHLHLQVQHK